MLKDFPVLMRGPKLAENTDFLHSGFPPLVLTLSEIGLRLPLDVRHAGNLSGDDGLRTHETEQLLARIRNEEAKHTEKAPDGAHVEPAPGGPATNTDKWLAERLRKFQPRYSSRRDTDISLNCQLKVDNQLIMCGHIARLWEEDFLQTAGKPTYQTLNSPAALQEAARPVLRYDGSYPGGAIGERVDGTQYWMSSDWGQVLTENFDAMSRQALKDGAVCRTLYLLTPNHAMALGLKIKDDAGARRYVVQLYDPNVTAVHQRSAITAAPDQAGVPAEIRTLKPHDFLEEDELEYYRLVDADNHSIPTMFCGEKVEPGVPRFSGDLPALDKQVMSFMLSYNLLEQLHAYTDQRKLVDNATLLEILTGSNPPGNPGLVLALDKGRSEVIEVLGDILKACQPPLSPAQLMELLSAKSSLGTSGLNRALQNGHAGAVKAFGILLKTCEPPLSSEQLMVLLSAKDGHGRTGLYAALHNGHAEAVEAFAELLKEDASTLTPEQFLDLLLIKPADGYPRLYQALFAGDAKWIEAYGNVLETVRAFLPTKQLAETLAAESELGRAALHSARNSGHVDAIAALEALRVKFVPHA